MDLSFVHTIKHRSSGQSQCLCCGKCSTKSEVLWSHKIRERETQTSHTIIRTAIDPERNQSERMCVAKEEPIKKQCQAVYKLPIGSVKSQVSCVTFDAGLPMDSSRPSLKSIKESSPSFMESMRTLPTAVGSAVSNIFNNDLSWNQLCVSKTLA